MGLLGEIYSFGNRTRNKLRGLLDDPKGYLQQTADQTANTLRDMTGANETAQQFALRDKINAGDKNALEQYRNLEKTIQNKLFDVALNFNPAAVGMTAKVAGANAIDEYAGLHRPPMKGSGAPLHDLTGGGNYYPDDVYSSNGLRYYGTGNDRIDREAWSLAMRVKDKPNATVKMYRAVPYEKSPMEQIADLESLKAKFLARGKFPEDSGFTNGSKWYEWASREIDRLKTLPEPSVQNLVINNGDWVTTSKQYAKEHGESALGGNYKIISQSVPARKLFTNGDSWAEFGYDETGKALLPNMLGAAALGAGGMYGLGLLGGDK